MAQRMQTIIAICLMMLMTLSCVRIDNTSDIDIVSTASLISTGTAVGKDSETLGVDRGYSRIEQQDYLEANNSAHLLTALFRRSQNALRSNERHEMSTAGLDSVSKVVLFSFIMILFATSGSGLSMPFRCLLYYIQDMDGKKKIA